MNYAFEYFPRAYSVVIFHGTLVRLQFVARVDVALIGIIAANGVALAGH